MNVKTLFEYVNRKKRRYGDYYNAENDLDFTSLKAFANYWENK